MKLDNLVAQRLKHTEVKRDSPMWFFYAQGRDYPPGPLLQLVQGLTVTRPPSSLTQKATLAGKRLFVVPPLVACKSFTAT